MTDRPAFHAFGRIAERWLDLAERRRDHFSELYCSGRWRLFYQEDSFRTHVREVAKICDRWASILERHRQLSPEPQVAELQVYEPQVDELELAEPQIAEPEVAVIDRDAA